MNLFSKLSIYIDYNNNYSIKRVLNILGNEFNIAISKKNSTYADEIIATAKQIYDNFCKVHDKNIDHFQKNYIKKVLSFIEYLISRKKTEF